MKKEKRFRIEIMAVGTELLSPYFRDTNSLFLSQRLNDLGMEVSFKTIVGDDWKNLLLCIKQALSRADIIFAIGGLGPTEDDKTREAFAEALGRELVYREELFQKIKERFERRGLSMPSTNLKQSYLIEGAEALQNKNGTAPGIWLDSGPQKIILLPGPPHELKPMFEESVWPKLQDLRKGYRARKVLKITGITESQMEALISDLYPQEPHLQVTTLAYPGQLEIHLASYSKRGPHQAEKEVKALKEKIVQRLKENVFSESGEELEEVVGNLLRQRKKTLAVAESCSGGFLSHRLTNIPGSSDYFLEGVVTYSNTAKSRLLGVPLSLIQKHGAVSAPVAEAMARGAKERAQASYGLAITGIAGPAGGTPEKPVGLVYIALAFGKRTKVGKNLFLGKREQVKFQSTQKALDMLRRHLLRTKKKK
jgi:nicotinamide-nucleotide amidase